MPRVKCFGCGKDFRRSFTRLLEAKFRGWKHSYCSIACLGRSSRKRQRFVCANPDCDRIIERTPSDLIKSIQVFCSRSCAAIINNSKFPKRQARINTCEYCRKDFKGRGKFCSIECKNKGQVVTAEKIIKQIKDFYQQHKRIPLKREFGHYKAARNRFGTWNKAVQAAGFEPNPVKFAKKYIANDGHMCDYLAEKIINDWFYARNISHEINVPYNHNRMTADFKVNGVLIEFLGLQGELETYDRLVTQKKNLWQKQDLKVIEIHPKDLFPESKLNEVLNFLSYDK